MPRANLILEEAVYIERPLGVHPIDDAEYVEGHAMAMQHLRRGEYFVEGRLAVLGHAIAVMQFLGAVDAEANEETVFLEEQSPLVVEQRAVGLEIVLDALVRLLVLLFELDHFVEELKSEQGRFASLPGEDNFIAVLAFYVLLDVGFENLVADAELAGTAEQVFFMQVIAIGAIQIADGPDRLDHGVVSARSSGLRRKWRHVGYLNQIAHQGRPFHVRWASRRRSPHCGRLPRMGGK